MPQLLSDVHQPALRGTDVVFYGQVLTADLAPRLRDELARIGFLDPEIGHGLADKLALLALKAICEGHTDPVTLSSAVLVVLSAEFPRYAA